MTDLPGDVVEEAERLTRLARRVGADEEAATYRERRDELVDEHGYEARVRGDDEGETLVLHPEEWLEDGVVRVERVEDTDRAVERPLSARPDESDWEAVEEHNRALVAAVRDEHGDAHAANVRAFADYMGNHHSRRMETATADDLREFVEAYYPRNAWPTDEERELLEQSLRLVFEVAGEPYPR